MKFVRKVPELELQVSNVGNISLITSDNVNLLTLLSSLLIIPVMYSAWLIFWDNETIWGIFKSESWQFIGSMLLIYLFHELTHLLAHPRQGFTDRSIVGANLKKLYFFVGYTDALPRNRLAFIVLFPLIILSLLPLILSYLLPQFASELAWCSIFNAASSGPDIYLAVTILKCVPKDYFIHGPHYGNLITRDSENLQNIGNK